MASSQFGVGVRGGFGVLERELEVARAQREPRERVLSRRHSGERAHQLLHDRGGRVRVGLVRQRLQHEREAAGRVTDLADELLEFASRARQPIRPRLEHAGEPVNPLVVLRQLFPACDRAQTGLRELELVRDAGGALGVDGVVRKHRGREELGGGGIELLALVGDFRQQRVRVDCDLARPAPPPRVPPPVAQPLSAKQPLSAAATPLSRIDSSKNEARFIPAI